MSKSIRKTHESVISISFSHHDILVLSDALRLAVQELTDASLVAERTSPASPLIERWRMHAESMLDLQERIDAAPI